VRSSRSPAGDKRVVAKGLLSAGGGDGTFEAGADGVSIGPDGHIYTVITSGTPKDIAVIPKNGKAQAVPMSLALGPGGAVYVGELAFGARPGKARVWRVPLDGTAPSVFATGFTAITGLAFGPDGSLYVTEWSTNPEKETAPAAIVRRKPDRTKVTLKSKSLLFPAGAAVAPDGTLYVSNASVLPARTPKKSPFKGLGGHILKITGSGLPTVALDQGWRR
jgi:sugar lactone lactonase YvrE